MGWPACYLPHSVMEETPWWWYDFTVTQSCRLVSIYPFVLKIDFWHKSLDTLSFKKEKHVTINVLTNNWQDNSCFTPIRRNPVNDKKYSWIRCSLFYPLLNVMVKKNEAFLFLLSTCSADVQNSKACFPFQQWHTCTMTNRSSSRSRLPDLLPWTLFVITLMTDKCFLSIIYREMFDIVLFFIFAL